MPGRGSRSAGTVALTRPAGPRSARTLSDGREIAGPAETGTDETRTASRGEEHPMPRIDDDELDEMRDAIRDRQEDRQDFIEDRQEDRQDFIDDELDEHDD